MARVFDTAVVALQMVESLRPLIAAIEKRDKDLARQTRRAGPSAYLNVEEGSRRRNGDRYYHYDVAAGSAAETRAALRCAIAMGYITPSAAEPCLGFIDRLLALLWRQRPQSDQTPPAESDRAAPADPAEAAHIPK